MKTPLDIARYVYGPTATAKDINPTLYQLKEKGVLRVTFKDPLRKTQPEWHLGLDASLFEKVCDTRGVCSSVV